MKDTIRYKDYVDEVKNLFRKSNALSDEIIDEYFEEKDTRDYLILAYKNYISGDSISNAYFPQAVAYCLDMMY